MRIVIAGDSTAAPKLESKRPETGWGECLHEFLSFDVEVKNHAHNGESSRSFVDSGRFDALKQDCEPGAILLIQFGHNDEKPTFRQHVDLDEYKHYLLKYVLLAYTQHMVPVIMTSIERRDFIDEHTVKDTHQMYSETVRELAHEYDLNFIDMQLKSRALLETCGFEDSAKFFNHVELGVSPNYPEGHHDNTHLSPLGAHTIASLVAQGLQELNLDELSGKLLI